MEPPYIPFWLEDRWGLAETHRKAGNTSVFPKWYFDAPTERQLDKLEELGDAAPADLTKGHASDLIGLHMDADPEHIKILQFFKKTTQGRNETWAKHDVALIFADPENVEAWKGRPALKEQLEFFKFFRIPIEKGISISQAEKLVNQHRRQMIKEKNPQLDEWDALEVIMDDLADPETRKDYGIRKANLGLVQTALKELMHDGMTLDEITSDLGALVEKLLEINPKLARN